MREMSLPDPEFSDHLDFMVTFRNGQVVEEQNELNPRQVIGMQIVRERGSISTPSIVQQPARLTVWDCVICKTSSPRVS